MTKTTSERITKRREQLAAPKPLESSEAILQRLTGMLTATNARLDIAELALMQLMQAAGWPEQGCN